MHGMCTIPYVPYHTYIPHTMCITPTTPHTHDPHTWPTALYHSHHTNHIPGTSLPLYRTHHTRHTPHTPHASHTPKPPHLFSQGCLEEAWVSFHNASSSCWPPWGDLILLAWRGPPPSLQGHVRSYNSPGDCAEVWQHTPVGILLLLVYLTLRWSVKQKKYYCFYFQYYFIDILDRKCYFKEGMYIRLNITGSHHSY